MKNAGNEYSCLFAWRFVAEYEKYSNMRNATWFFENFRPSRS